VTKPERAKIILGEIDIGAYPIPSYFGNDVLEAIVKALVIIEREEAKEIETPDP
jgi:hypothetical protein